VKLEAAPGNLPAGVRVYAIGDIHGCAERLAALHAQIAGDCMLRPVPRAVIVYLGDYIDRGPDSAGVVEMLTGPPPVPDAQVVTLMGNHERCMLDAVGGSLPSQTDWMFNGGGPALKSWRIDPMAPWSTWNDLIPQRHLEFIEGLALSFRLGGYFFVHAGVRPGMALDSQAASDLMSIRHMFLSSEADFGAVVVHGHTPADDPVVRANRIGVDTGAVFGGKLTCVVLEGERIGFIQA
jgi:serine/threonine protein phosphatase 1